MTDPTDGCPDCDTLTAEHDEDCTRELRAERDALDAENLHLREQAGEMAEEVEWLRAVERMAQRVRTAHQGNEQRRALLDLYAALDQRITN